MIFYARSSILCKLQQRETNIKCTFYFVYLNSVEPFGYMQENYALWIHHYYMYQAHAWMQNIGCIWGHQSRAAEGEKAMAKEHSKSAFGSAEPNGSRILVAKRIDLWIFFVFLNQCKQYKRNTCVEMYD